MMHRVIVLVLFIMVLLAACGSQSPHDLLNGRWQIGVINPDGTFTAGAGYFQIDFEKGTWVSKGPGGEYHGQVALISEDSDKVTFKVTFKVTGSLEGDTATAFILNKDHVRFVFPGTIVETERVR